VIRSLTADEALSDIQLFIVNGMSWVLQVSMDGSLIHKVIFRPEINIVFIKYLMTGSKGNSEVCFLDMLEVSRCTTCASRKFKLLFPGELVRFDP